MNKYFLGVMLCILAYGCATKKDKQKVDFNKNKYDSLEYEKRKIDTITISNNDRDKYWK